MSIAKKFHDLLKAQNDRVKCLHLNAGEECNRVIRAHTIQKGGQLSKIEENGHVYGFSADWSLVRRNGDRPAPKKMGIQSASTFKGFCGYHDNQMFEKIDNSDFQANKEFAALYGYRTISKELFEKESSADIFHQLSQDNEIDPETREFMRGMYIGNQLGLERIRHHKSIYEDMLKSENYDDMRYIAFGMSSKWTSQFASGLFPDFDFMGKPLQDLSDPKIPLDLVTFFTAPSTDSWNVVFAWHDSSQNCVSKLINSIHESVCSGVLIEDLLFRLVLTTCENHMFNISWWDALPQNSKDMIMDRFRDALDTDQDIDPNYLAKGLEGISDWGVSTVVWDSPEG